MGLPRLSRDSPRKSESGSGSNGQTNGVKNAEQPTHQQRNSTSGDSNAGASPKDSSSSKRPSRFRLGSLKQLGAATRAEIRANVRNDWDWPLPDLSTTNGTAGPGDGDAGEEEEEEEESAGRRGGAPGPWACRVDPATTRFVERTPGSEESGEGSEDEDDLGHARYLQNGTTAHAAAAANGDGKSRLLNGGFGALKGSMNGAAGHKRNVSSSSAATRRPGSGYPSSEAAAAARKERRRRRLREEMSWNEGLQVFEARRNAWTGSILKPPEATEVGAQRNGADACVNGTDRKATVPDDVAATIGSTPGNQHSTTSKTAEDEEAPSSNADDLVIYTPVPAPIVSPEHPIRKEIVPATYSQIYGRVVIQGTTPNLPINLADMTSILVEGWKEDDKWPPKPGPLDPLVGRRKNRGIGHSMKSNGHSRNTSGEKEGGLYQNIKKVLRIRTDKGPKSPTSPVALLDV